MHLTDAELTHAHHLDLYRWALNGHEANDSYFLAEAAQMHVLLVIDAVSELVVQAVQKGQSAEGGVHDHLVYGVARRGGDIRLALREIVQVSPVGRVQPLAMDESYVVSRALNTIYINVRGTLDNLAWAIIERYGGREAHGLSPQDVDLFGRKFSKSDAWQDLIQDLKEIAPWSAELARLRNPSAHQIPLSIVPAEMDEADAAEYRRLHAKMLAPLPEGPFDAAAFKRHREEHESIKRQITGLGVYRALFAHRPSDGLTQLYPTVAEDVGKMVRSARVVLRHL